MLNNLVYIMEKMALSSDPVLFLSDDFCIARCWSQRLAARREPPGTDDWPLMTDTKLALLPTATVLTDSD